METIQEKLYSTSLSLPGMSAEINGEPVNLNVCTEAAEYIDSLEAQITDLQQQLARLNVKYLHNKIDNSIKTEKILAALKMQPEAPASNAEIRRQLGMDMINAERNGDRYES